MTTQSEPTGTRHIEDVVFHERTSLTTRIKPLTPKGYLWIRENMDHAEDFTVVVQREFEEELKTMLEKDGLKILER